MIKLLVSLLVNFVDFQKGKTIHKNKLWNLIAKLKRNTVIRNLVSWGVFLIVPFILFNFMDNIGTKEILAELQPQVAAIYELDTNETLDKQLHAIWRTPKNYRLRKQFASYANRDDILEYYSRQLENDGWKNEGMSEYHRHDTNVLMSQTYTWSKNGYILEITFNLDDNGTKEKYTEDGKLKYYINVEPMR